MKKICAAFLALTMLLSGCSFSRNDQNQEPAGTPATATNVSSAPLAAILQAQPIFAASADIYHPAAIVPDVKESETDALQAKNIANIQNSLNIQFTTAQKKFLQTNKFLLLDNFTDAQKFCFSGEPAVDRSNCGVNLSSATAASDYMLTLLQGFSGSPFDFERTPSNAIYINADVILHTYHVFLDRYIKKLEQKKLYPLLLGIITKLQDAAFQTLKESAQQEQKDSLQRVAGYLTLGR